MSAACNGSQEPRQGCKRKGGSGAQHYQGFGDEIAGAIELLERVSDEGIITVS
jgi:hypothetical protein